MKKLFSLFFGLASYLLFLAPNVNAATVFSPVLELEANPGETQPGVLKLYNETNQDLLLISAVEEFTAGDNETGQPKFIPTDQRQEFLGWFNLAQESILLVPGQVALIPFTVSIPPDAIPGGYFAAVFWQSVPVQQGEQPSVGVSSRVGTLVLLKVKGDVLEQAELLDFKTVKDTNIFYELPVNFSTRFSNLGNVHLVPSGKITLRNYFGKTTVLKLNPEDRYVLPRSIRRFEVAWGSSQPGNFLSSLWPGVKQEFSNLSFGPHTASLELTYGIDNPQTVTQQFSFWVIPVRSIIFKTFILVVLILFIRINSKVKRLKNKKTDLSEPVKTPSNAQQPK